jgi:hypothetical protein
MRPNLERRTAMTAANPTHLEQVIDQLLTKLEDTAPESDDYARIVDQLAKLHNLLPKNEPFVKPDVVIGAATNLIGILAILNYERVHIITSKAVGFVLKSRLI